MRVPSLSGVLACTLLAAPAFASGTNTPSNNECVPGPLAAASGATNEWIAREAIGNSRNADHAITLHNFFSCSGDNKADFWFVGDTGRFTTFDGSATLTGIVEAQDACELGSRWEIEFTFGGAQACDLTQTKNPFNADDSLWDCFDFVSGSLVELPTSGTRSATFTQRGPDFQLGEGANDKTSAFGASSWFNWTDGTNTGVGDINVELDCPSCPAGKVTYEVESYAANGHSLWFHCGGPQARLDFLPGAVLELDANPANGGTLEGVAVVRDPACGFPAGTIWDVSTELDAAPSTTGPKSEGPFRSVIDGSNSPADDWLYYIINTATVSNPLVGTATLTHRPTDLSKGFQIGDYANVKNDAFGAATWYDWTLVDHQGALIDDGKGDYNLNLYPVCPNDICVEVDLDLLDFAKDVNVFTCGDFDATSTDVLGSMRVGGNADLLNFGLALNDPMTMEAGVIDGSLTWTNGTAYGPVYYGTSQTTSNVDFQDGLAQDGDRFDFDAVCEVGGKAEVALQELFAPTNTGSFVQEPWGKITFSSNASGAVYFDVKASAILAAQYQEKNVDAPNADVVVIRIENDLTPGTRLDIIGGQMNLTSISRDKVVYVFDGPEVKFAQISFQGTFFAPYAHVRVENGNVEGTLIAHRVELLNGGELHNFPLDVALECPPDPTPVTGGNPGGASWCNADCQAAVFESQATNFATDADTWFKVAAPVSGWTAWNMLGRDIYVNGQLVTPGAPLPVAYQGAYYFRVTGGTNTDPWAGITFW